MTREQKLNKWVSENYEWLRTQVNTNIAKDLMSGYGDDLLHHILLDLYNLPEHKLDQMLEDKKLKYYVLRGAGIQLRSSTSPFYRIHRKERYQSREMGLPESDSNIFETGEVYEEYEENLYQCFHQELENLHWYLKVMVTHYFIDQWSIKQIYQHYNIPKKHVINDINRALDVIREKCKDC